MPVARIAAMPHTTPPACFLPARLQLDTLNQWINILQSVQLPFAVIPVSALHTHCLPALLSVADVPLVVLQRWPAPYAVNAIDRSTPPFFCICLSAAAAAAHL